MNRLAVYVCCFLSAGIIGCSGSSQDDSEEQPALKPVPQQTMSVRETSPTPPQTVVEKPKVINPATLYNRCAACHLKAGEGVPGAFPPLKDNFVKLTESDAGRAYLVNVIKYGANGQLTINNDIYRGVMPAQAGFSPEKISALLNYINTDISVNDTDAFSEFTPQEVKEILNFNGRMSGTDVINSRPVFHE